MRLTYKFSKEDLSKIPADIVVIQCKKVLGDGKKPGQLLKSDGGMLLDKALGGLLTRVLADEMFDGSQCTSKIIDIHSKIAAKKILIVGIGEEKDLSLDSLRLIGSKITKIANGLRAKSIAGVLQPEKIKNLSPSDRMQALVEGMQLGGYRFDLYKNKKDLEKPTLQTIKVIFGGNPAAAEKATKLGTLFAEAISYARDLVNMPGHDLTPEVLAIEAKKIAKAGHLFCKVLNEKEIEKDGMGLLTAISKGAANPPRFIHLGYKPKKKAKIKIAIVGKGITFDSGGYNLKSTIHMENMKQDMAGAAALLSIMKLLPTIRPSVQIDGYIPATENMIDGKAHKPGDVIRSRSGKTVEILNLDAEGRLILADAIDHAKENSPDIMIDMATLTGGVRYALGEIYTAILGNDQGLIDKIISASKSAGEPMWQLPLEKEYLKGFKESIADLNNNGKSYASTICGALFINEFVGKTKWAHLDIAESAWAREERGYRTKGGTGAMIQTIINFLASY